MEARKTLLILTNNVLGGVLGLVAYFFIGRYMNPGALGMVGYALSIIGLFHILGSLGFDQAHVKRVSEGQDLGVSLTTYTHIKLWLTGAFAIIAFASVYAWWRWRGLSDTTIQVVLVILLYYVFLLVRHIPLQTFNALRSTARSEFMTLVENLTRIPLVIAAALLFGFWTREWVPFLGLAEFLADYAPRPATVDTATGALYLAAAWAASMLASLLVGIWLLHRHRLPFGRFDSALARRYWTFAGPIALISLFQVLVTETDRVMIGYFLEAADVGYYLAAQRYSSIIYMIPAAAATLVFPMFSEIAARRGADAVAASAYRAQRIIGLVVLWAAIFPLVYAQEAFPILMSNQFLPAAPILQWLTVWAVLASFTVVNLSVLQGLDRPRLTSQITAVSLSVNLALNLVLIPSSILGVPLVGLGALGAAVGTTVAQAVSLLLLTWQTRRILGRTYLDARLLRPIVAAGVTMLILHLGRGLPLFGGLDRWYDLAVAAIVGTVLYVALLALLREVGRRDVEQAWDLLHPGRMARYVRSELRRE